MDENRNSTKQQYLVGDANSFGEPFLKYLDERGIGWVACWYDDGWEPPLFTNNFEKPTKYGEFVFGKL
jgi:hypothetical protein